MSSKPTIKSITGFTITGFSTRTRNSVEFAAETAKIPALWQKFYSSELIKHSPVFGVYSDYESDANGFYTVTVGISQEDQADPDCKQLTIHSGNYLVFTGTGPMPATVIATWKQVWQYFANEAEQQRNFISDFEVYKGAEEVAIYISIMK